MALQTDILRADLFKKIKEALDSPFDENSSPEEIKTNLANSIANAVADGVDTWIKTGLVTIQPGITVATPLGAGVTTSTGTGSIS